MKINLISLVLENFKGIQKALLFSALMRVERQLLPMRITGCCSERTAAVPQILT